MDGRATPGRSRCSPCDEEAKKTSRKQAQPDFRPLADRSLARAVEAWFRARSRPLPWRTTPRDPYLSLVSEFMLQQTQVSRVLEKFAPFVARFPTFEALAGAAERDVLAMWSGLGYYRRAKHLHGAAKAVVQTHGGILPDEVENLMGLPGVGRYTAGSLASIVFKKREPIVDGNVARVLLRVNGRDGAADERETIGWVWERAGALVRASSDPAALNEGLMELGATVCTTRRAHCAECPLRGGCVAYRDGTVEEIPRPKRSPRRRVVHSASVLVHDGRGRLLVEQRPPDGMWASMWQAPTLECEGRAPTSTRVRAWAGVGKLLLVERFDHLTSHREVRFTVWKAADRGAAVPNESARLWRTAAQIHRLGLSNPQRRILLAFGARSQQAGTAGSAVRLTPRHSLAASPRR